MNAKHPKEGGVYYPTGLFYLSFSFFFLLSFSCQNTEPCCIPGIESAGGRSMEHEKYIVPSEATEVRESF